MKRKGLIITATIALLAVSCGKGGKSGKKGFDDFYSDAMKLCIGEVLPYVAFDKDATYCEFQTDGYEGYFILGDDNETNLLEGYGDKIAKLGYEAIYEDEEDPEPAYYYKSDEETYAISVTAQYYEATEDYNAGNEIYIEFTFLNGLNLVDDFKLAKDFYKLNGIKDVKIPKFETAAEELAITIYYSSAYETLRYYYYGPDREELETYAESLGDYGYRYGEAEYAEDYLVKYKKTRAWFEIQDYINYGGSVRFIFYIGPEEYFDFPADRVVDFLSDTVEVSPTIFPAYPTGDNTTFEYDDSWADYWGGCDVYVYGTDEDAVATYIERLQDNGWTITLEDEGDYVLNHAGDGTYDVQLQIIDYLSYGYIDIFVAPVEHVPEPEHADTFPLDELNAFLEEYDLGFTLEEALPEGSEGVGFEYNTAIRGGYAFFQVITEGDVASEWNTALNPILTTAGYTYSNGYYSNAVDHQVVIGTEGGLTYVTFWE